MFKIKSKYFIIVFLILIVLISGCKKAECKVNADCSPRECKTVVCTDKKCQYSIATNCCGNAVCEEPEEDECNCEMDCGKCEGKGKLTIRNRQYDATYLQYLCNAEKKCVFGVDPKDITETKLVDERDIGFFVLETQTTFNKPFNVLKDKFKFQVKLKDVGEDLVPPVKITNIQLKEGQILFGEKNLNEGLNSVGDIINTEIQVDYRPTEIEEERTLSYKLDYEYTKKVKTTRNEDGSWNYENQLVRDSYEKRFTSKVFFVNPGE